MNDSTPLYVGVDVGGTKINAALVRATGEIVARQKRGTLRDASAKKVLGEVMAVIQALLDEAGVKPADVAGIGIGAPGVVDPAEGLVVFTPNVNMTDLNVVKPVSKEFGVPVALGNDVNVGTLGEQWLGAARGARSAFGIFVGTGIGGGLIIDGKLVIGARDAAAEIGHIVMQPDGPKCGCGQKGCLEALAGRAAIERDIRAAVEAGRKTLLTRLLDGDLSSIRSKALKEALKKGDPLVTEVLRRASEVLGYACVTVRHVVDPEVIVLGGGVMEACGDFILPIVENIVNQRSMPGKKSDARVVASMLGDDAGVLGAAALIQKTLGHRLSAAAFERRSAGITLTEAGPGVVSVNGEIHARDFTIRADGKIRKRRKSFVRVKEDVAQPPRLGWRDRSRGRLRHLVGAEELAKVLKGEPETLIIGTGRKGRLKLSGEAEALLKTRGVKATLQPTSEAIRLYNDTKGRKALLMHLACPP